MSKKSLCIQKLRLFYFELNLLKVEFDVVNNIVKTYPTDKMLVSLVRCFIYLNSCKKIFSEFQSKLLTCNDTDEELTNINNVLSKNLRKLASFRVKTFNLLSNDVFYKDEEVKFSLLNLQKNIDKIYEFFTEHCDNTSFDISLKSRERFLADINIITSMINLNGHVTINLAKNSKTIFEKLTLYWSLKQWYIKLANFKQEPNPQVANEFMRNISDAKYIFLLNLINMKNNNTSAIILELINSINVQHKNLLRKEILDLLEDKIIHLRFSISEAEIVVLNTTKSKNYLQKSINLFKQTFYYKLAENYMNASNQFTQGKFANIPILNSHLNQSFVEFFSLLLAGSMIGSELYNKSWFGLPYNVISTMADILLNFNMISRVYVNLMSDELKVTQHMKYLKQVMQFVLSFMLFGLSTGLVSGNIFKFIGGYFFAVMMQFLFSNVSNNFQMNNNKNSQHTLSFLSYIVQLVGLIAGTFLWQQVLKTSKYFTNTVNTENILSDKEQCLAYPKVCYQEVLKVLELENKNINLDMVNQQYRKLARLYHPDKANLFHDSNRFFKLTEARSRWMELNTQLQPPISISYQAPTKKLSLN